MNRKSNNRTGAFNIFKGWVKYYFTSQTAYHVHSPFIFDFVTNVLNQKTYQIPAAEKLRSSMLRDKSTLKYSDLGAGSIPNLKNRTVSDLAKGSLTSPKYSKLYKRIIEYYQYKAVLELGTCLGINAIYLASASTNPEVYTIEGVKPIYEIALQNFQSAAASNIKIINDEFDHAIKKIIKDGIRFDFILIDGNHRLEPTLKYFNNLLPLLNDNGIIVLDDIRWSEGMHQAWNTIQRTPGIICADLYFKGLVFKRPEQQKQHFYLRF